MNNTSNDKCDKKMWINPYFLLLFILLSISMSAIIMIFDQLIGLGGPQITMYDQLKNIHQFIQSQEDINRWYRLFFRLDFIWAFTLMIVLRKCILASVRKSKGLDSHADVYWSPILKVWAILSLIAYGLDVVENVSYVNGWFQYLECIVMVKNITYFLVLATPILHYLICTENDFIKILKRFWLSSYISLIVIILIAIVMIMLPQGGTIVIDMLSNPIKFLPTILLVNFLAVLISHYPIYIDFKNDEKLSETYNLEMHLLNPKILGLGIISYYRKKPKEKNDVTVPNLWRILLGVMLLSMWTCAMIFPIKNALYPGINLVTIYILLLVLFGFYYKIREREKDKLKDFLKAYKGVNPITGKDDFNRYEVRARRFSWFYFFYLSVFIFLVIIISVLTYAGWTLCAQSCTVLLSLVNLHLFVEFRICRSMLKYIRANKENAKTFVDRYEAESITQKTQDAECKNANADVNIKREVVTEFEKRFFADTKHSAPRLSLARLSDNVVYLKWMRAFGIGVFFYLLAINIGIEYVDLYTSSISIVFAFIILLYAFIALWVKHFLFYRDFCNVRNYAKSASLVDGTNECSNRKRVVFNRVLPVMFIVVVGVLYYARGKTNNIHQLAAIKETLHTDEAISFSGYVKEYKASLGNDEAISIAADGGGLKANLWTMLLLDKFWEDGTLEDVFCISGVSGGAIGIGNYYRLAEKKGDKTFKDEMISEIGAANILSIDAAGLFLHDLVFSICPKADKDRSHYAMKKYARLLGKQKTFEDESFRAVWKNVYDSLCLPMIVINSASTDYKQGCAVSVNNVGDLPASINILDIGTDSTLSYYDAVSTSNRFPIASPAAKIAGKGYFVDGGYFENSGLLSAQHLVEKANFENDKHKYINIRNGKEDWIIEFVRRFEEKMRSSDPNYVNIRKEIKKTEEVSAILKTLVSIDKLPMTLRESIESSDQVSIQYYMMPHIITIADIENVISGTVQFSNELYSAVEFNNKKIKDILRDDTTVYDYASWGVVTPPLARVLSEPAVGYEKAMVRAGFFTPCIDNADYNTMRNEYAK